MTDTAEKKPKQHDVKILIDVGTVVTITGSANSIIDKITTDISKKIGSELEEKKKESQK